MERRNYMKTIGCGIGTLLLGRNTLAARKKQPNLLFVFPDQMRREAMGFWQKGKFKHALRTATDPVITPTLDKLAEESIVFTQAVSTCPVCSPHRAMLMSGMFPWQNGVVNNCHESRQDGLRHDIQCFTDVLSGAGYETCYVGKTHWERNDPLFDVNENYVGTTEAPGGLRFNPDAMKTNTGSSASRMRTRIPASIPTILRKSVAGRTVNSTVRKSIRRNWKPTS